MNDENRLIGISWDNRKLLNNLNIFNRNLGFLLFAEISLAALIIIGDYFIFDSPGLITRLNKHVGISQQLLRAGMDNISHMFVGVISWSIISYSKLNTNEILAVAFLSSIIDIDHFISAKSLKLSNAISLANRPFLHNSLTLFLANILFFVLLSVFNSSKKLNWSLILFIAWFSHHIRDANRRGMWFGSIYTTKPIKDEWYLTIILIVPLALRHLYQNDGFILTIFISKNFKNTHSKTESHIG